MSKTFSSCLPKKNSTITTVQASFLSDFLPNRLKALEVLQARRQRREAVLQTSGRVQEAVRDTYTGPCSLLCTAGKSGFAQPVPRLISSTRKHRLRCVHT